MWTSWTPECSARSIYHQPFARRSFLIRSPAATQMSLAMWTSSDLAFTLDLVHNSLATSKVVCMPLRRKTPFAIAGPSAVHVPRS